MAMFEERPASEQEILKGLAEIYGLGVKATKAANSRRGFTDAMAKNERKTANALLKKLGVSPLTEEEARVLFG